VKNDHRDGVEWLKRMRLGELPESWIAPAGLRGLREMDPGPGQAGGVALGVEGR